MMAPLPYSLGPLGRGRGTSGPPLTGLEAWYEVADSGAASAWVDLSGHSRTLAQGSSALRPTYGATAGPGGAPALTFDGVDDVLYTAGNFPLTGNLTALVLAVVQPTTQARPLMGWGNTLSGQGYGLFFGLRTTNGWSVEFAGNQPAGFDGGLANTWQLISTTKTPGAINTTTGLWVNGTARTQGFASSGTPNTASAPLGVGVWANDPSNGYFAGKLAALLIYSVADSTTRLGAESYLHSRHPSLY